MFMKKFYLLFIVLCVAAFFNVNAQNLIYSEDFEGDVSDLTIVGPADATIGVFEDSGDADHGTVFHNNPTSTTDARTRYLQLPATIFSDAQAAINASQGLTISFWVNDNSVGVDADGYWWSAMFSAYAAAPAPNNDKPMFQLNTNKRLNVNFDLVNSDGNNYGWFDNIDWGADNLEVVWLDNGGWHFYTIVLTPTSSNVYIDGVLSSTKVADTNNGTRIDGLFNVIGDLTYITIGGNSAWDWGDGDTPFSYDKIKIYDDVLSSAQIISLMNTDDIVAPILTVDKSSLYFDDISTEGSIVVNGLNLTGDISIVAPTGITVDPTSISAASAEDVTVTVTYDGSTVVDGDITLTSGDLVETVAVLTSNNDCFIPLHDAGNMITDPTFSAATLAEGGFGGWGPTAITNEGAYCGRGSAYVRGSCWPDGGSIDFTLSAANGTQLKANTTYRLRAMINSQATPGTIFQLVVAGDNAGNIYFDIAETTGWEQFDQTFTTSASVGDGGLYFNSCAADQGKTSPAITDTCFIDNYELYEEITTDVESSTSGAKVYATSGMIKVEVDAVSSVVVYSLDGKVVASETVESSETIPVSAGLYIVVINGEATKVMVSK